MYILIIYYIQFLQLLHISMYKLYKLLIGIADLGTFFYDISLLLQIRLMFSIRRRT